MLQVGQDVLQPTLFRGTDEQDMTGPNVFDLLIATDFERSAAHRLTPDSFVQVRTEWIVSQDADDEGSRRVGKSAGWPVDKLSEVEQEDGLDLILRRPRSLRPETRAPQKQHDPSEEIRPDPTPCVATGSPAPRGRLQKCHSTRP